MDWHQEQLVHINSASDWKLWIGRPPTQFFGTSPDKMMHHGVLCANIAIPRISHKLWLHCILVTSCHQWGWRVCHLLSSDKFDMTGISGVSCALFHTFCSFCQLPGVDAPLCFLHLRCLSIVSAKYILKVFQVYGFQCFVGACYTQVSGVCTLPSQDQTILSPSTSVTDL